MEPTAEHEGEVGDAGIAFEFLNGVAHFAAPVGVLPSGAGKVLLFGFLGEVLLIEDKEAGAGGGEEPDDGVVEFAGELRRLGGIAGVAGREEAEGVEHFDHLVLVFEAGAHLVPEGIFAAEEAGSAAGLDVAAEPVAGEGGQVVGGGTDNGFARIFVGVFEEAAILFFEVEEAVAQDAEFGEAGADVVLDGAEILADDHHAIAVAFEGDDAKQVPPAFTHEGAFGGTGAGWDPVEAEEAHDVIDPEGAAVAAVVADGGGEELVTAGAVVIGVRRREGPVLALGGEIVRGRSDAATVGVKAGVGPEVAAAAVGGEGKVMIQADGHTGVGGVLLGGVDLGIDEPVDILPELDALPVEAGEGGDFGGIGILVVGGPVRPDPKIPVPPVEILIERAVDGKAFEEAAFLAAEEIELASAIGASAEELAVEHLEEEAFEAGDAFVVDEFRGAESGDATGGERAHAEGEGRGVELRDGLDIEIEEVAVESGSREIGAGVVGGAIGEGVERVEGDEGGTGGVAGPGGEALEVTEITGAPVPFRSEAVETDGDASQTLVLGDGGRAIDARRAVDEGTGGDGAVGVELGAVVAEGETGGKRHAPPDPDAAIDDEGLDFGQVLQRGGGDQLAAFLELNGENRNTDGAGGQRDGGPRGGFGGDDADGERGEAFAVQPVAESAVERVDGGGIDAHGLENGALNVRRRAVFVAPDVPIDVLHAMGVGDAPQRGRQIGRGKVVPRQDRFHWHVIFQCPNPPGIAATPYHAQ